MSKEIPMTGDGETNDLVQLGRLLNALELTNTFVFDQDKDFRFVRVYNPMYGFTGESFVGKTDEDFISAEYAQKILPVKKRVLKTGKSEQIAFSAEIAGALRHYILRVSRLENEAGEHTGITIVGSDITEIRVSENQRDRMQARLEHLQRYESMAVMAAGISHDFNNLLSGLFGYIDLAHDSTVDPKTRMYIGKALATIDRARQLTKELVTYAKGGVPQKAPVAMDLWIRDTVLAGLDGRPANVNFKIKGKLPAVLADEAQIARVVEALVTNGYQAAAEADRKAHLIVTAEDVMVNEGDIPGLRNDKYLRISVADNGSGVPDGIKEKIFEPYFSTKGQGRGLGLATSFSIIQHHDGLLEMTSSSDQGSVFSIYLPVSTEKEKSKSRLARKPSSSGGRVLLMDDDEFILDAFADVLISLGYGVRTAKSGQEVIDILTDEHADQPFSAIILDLNVENGRGAKETIQELRQLVGDIPVFIASGSEDDEAMINHARYGFTDRINKPYKRKELSSLLRNHIGRP